MEARKTTFANGSGILSVASILFLWVWIWGNAPVTNVYVIFVVIPIVAAVSLIAAIVAALKSSRWWLLALFLPIITALDVLLGG
jgi:hypothetical protein